MKRVLEGTERVIQLFNSGLTQIQVAATLGRSQHYVSKRLLAAGIARTKKATYSIKMAGQKFVPDANIVAMYVGGLSSVDISKKIGRSHGYVLRHVNAAGVTRSAGETLHSKALSNVPNVRVTKQGYLSFSHAGRDRLLHRAIYEAAIGRKLGRKEHVHHKDGNKKNNALSNLELLTASDHISSHVRFDKPPCMLCGTPSRNRGLCNPHYIKMRKAGRLHEFPYLDKRWVVRAGATKWT